jgi:hypothetical protein
MARAFPVDRGATRYHDATAAHLENSLRSLMEPAWTPWRWGLSTGCTCPAVDSGDVEVAGHGVKCSNRAL